MLQTVAGQVLQAESANFLLEQFAAERLAAGIAQLHVHSLTVIAVTDMDLSGLTVVTELVRRHWLSFPLLPMPIKHLANGQSCLLYQQHRHHWLRLETEEVLILFPNLPHIKIEERSSSAGFQTRHGWNTHQASCAVYAQESYATSAMTASP